jgi:hypothetical protein
MSRANTLFLALLDDVKMPTMIKRTIKPAAGSSRVTPEEAKAAARLVYRDGKTGRLVIVDGERSDRKSERAVKRVGARIDRRDSAKLVRGSSRRASTPPASARKH